MSGDARPADHDCDVAVVGAGLAGLTAALAFAKAGFSVVCCGPAEPPGNGRTVALLDSSIAYLEALDLWTAIAPAAAPLRILRLVDDTGSLFPPRPVEFRCDEIGLDAFGWNVENAAMSAALGAQAARAANLLRLAAPVASYEFSPAGARAELTSGEAVAARLIVGADGRASPARRAADLSTRTQTYPQSALTVLLAHALPHCDASSEFQTRQGPFTLVPLPATPSAAHRSSLVWLMAPNEARRRAGLSDADLANEIERQAQSILGGMRVEGKCGVFPMARQSAPRIVATRLALVGDAAHVFPPIGAQGLNLGLRDVEALVEAARGARDEGRDIGAEAALRDYAEARRADIALRAHVVDGLNRALLTRFAPLDAARGLGLAALGAIGPLRRFVMREGVAPRFARARRRPAAV